MEVPLRKCGDVEVTILEVEVTIREYTFDEITEKWRDDGGKDVTIAHVEMVFIMLPLDESREPKFPNTKEIAKLIRGASARWSADSHDAS